MSRDAERYHEVFDQVGEPDNAVLQARRMLGDRWEDETDIQRYQLAKGYIRLLSEARKRENRRLMDLERAFEAEEDRAKDGIAELLDSLPEGKYRGLLATTYRQKGEAKPKFEIVDAEAFVNWCFACGYFDWVAAFPNIAIPGTDLLLDDDKVLQTTLSFTVDEAKWVLTKKGAQELAAINVPPGAAHIAPGILYTPPRPIIVTRFKGPLELGAIERDLQYLHAPSWGNEDDSADPSEAKE